MDWSRHESAQNICKEGKFPLNEIFWRRYSSESWFSLQPVRTPKCQSLDASHREKNFYKGPNDLADSSHQEQKSYEGLDSPAEATHKE